MFDWLKRVVGLMSGQPRDGQLLAVGPAEVHGNLSPAPLTPEVEHREQLGDADRGRQALAQGNLEQAEECFRGWVLTAPNSVDARIMLGRVLIERKLYGDATTHLNRAVLLDPSSAMGFYLLGRVALARGEFSTAISHFSEARELRPGEDAIVDDLGSAYYNAGQQDLAKKTLLEALPDFPQSAMLRYRIGNLLLDEGSLESAIEWYDRALSLQPNLPEAHLFKGQALLQQGSVVAAIDSLRAAVLYRPDYFEAHSSLLWLLSFSGAVGGYLEEAKGFGERVFLKAQPYQEWRVGERGSRPGGMDDGRGDGESRLENDRRWKLRVGLVSGDFRNHPVGLFLEGVLARLDAQRVELYAYSANPRDDDLTQRIKGSCARWTSIAEMSDQEAARRIYDDGIDILIDLAGHSGHNRLPVFAWKPAPVQLSWLGYLASTGVPGIDYVLADPISVPVEREYQFTEQVWRLPQTLNCFTPPPEHPKLVVTEPPVLRNGYITFGSFQRMNKLGDVTLALWARVLKAIPQARLCLRNKQMHSSSAREKALRDLKRAGIAEARVTLAEPLEKREEFLATYAQVDIVLDTYPYPGTTTTCEALWMGVPTVTLAGETMLERIGASVLTCAGLAEWVAWSEEDYVDVAVRRAKDVEGLVRLRAGLREQVGRTPLFDAGKFAPQLEQALFAMWQAKMSAQS